ncbi:type VI secretion protein [Enterovibrio sp. ZSDZ35]|uniref:Type VI secretion protein n=1 Tax=Enterovibrio qingdaonensis TaxID=2899818 RepID=A0ABT5QKN3_9GAMM|nr:type VI secretion system-associated protein TagO [Enterovibrio sp. ZSDZ35]MDD1780856.1 type VI secretion protein [Enterovibrio sp. ZSDZ35]
MNKKVFWAGMLLFSASASSHGLDDVLSECASIIGKSARVSCYDALATKLNVVSSNTVSRSHIAMGNWALSEIMSPIDDSETVTIRLRELPGKNKWREAIDLVARCRNGKTELYISWNNFLGGEAHVLTRVGNEKAVGANWQLSGDKRTTFHSQPTSFLKTISTSNRLVAQITPYNENAITAIFDTTGLDNAVMPIRKLCQW